VERVSPTYAFLVAERATFPPSKARCGTIVEMPTLPEDCRPPSAADPYRASRAGLNCDVRSRCASPPCSTDVHAAPNLDQIEKVQYMFDAVVLNCARVDYFAARQNLIVLLSRRRADCQTEQWRFATPRHRASLAAHPVRARRPSPAGQAAAFACPPA
jgi:hypothetical protein